MPKKKLTELEKAKAIYTTELVVFAALFLILGVLFVARVISAIDWKQTLFVYATLIGGVLLIADFLWAVISKKRRRRIALIDKILLFPVALALLIFDICALALKIEDPVVFGLVIGIDFIILASIYVFEAAWHWFYPVPGLIDGPEEVSDEPEAREDQAKEMLSTTDEKTSDEDPASRGLPPACDDEKK